AAGHLRYRRPCWSAASPSKRWSSSPMLAFYGASFNPQLKMKTIKARDYSPYSIVLKELSSKPQGVFPVGPLETDAVLFGCAQDAEFNSSQHLVDPGTSSAQQGCVSVSFSKLSSVLSLGNGAFLLS
ncbi:unnamed protein product, partial [Tilletia controversa]